MQTTNNVNTQQIVMILSHSKIQNSYTTIYLQKQNKLKSNIDLANSFLAFIQLKERKKNTNMCPNWAKLEE